MARVGTALRRLWLNKWGRRLTGAALVRLLLEMAVAVVVFGGFAWFW